MHVNEITTFSESPTYDEETLMKYDADKENISKRHEEEGALLDIGDERLLKRHWGKHFVFCFWRGEPAFTIGPNWILALVTFSAMMIIGILIVFFCFKQNLSSLLTRATIAMVAWQGVTYLLMILRNPGLLTNPRPTSSTDSDFIGQKNYCKTCKIVGKNTTLHCEICDICVNEHHHHCKWVGKCVGRRNLMLYYVFTCSTPMYIIYCAFVCIQLISSTA